MFIKHLPTNKYNEGITELQLSDPSVAYLCELPSASQDKVTHQRKGDEILIKQLKTPATLLDFLFPRWFRSD